MRKSDLMETSISSLPTYYHIVIFNATVALPKPQRFIDIISIPFELNVSSELKSDLILAVCCDVRWKRPAILTTSSTGASTHSDQGRSGERSEGPVTIHRTTVEATEQRPDFMNGCLGTLIVVCQKVKADSH